MKGSSILDDRKRYYYVAAAARIAGVSQKAMWNWAAKGVTSFGFELAVVHGLPCDAHKKALPRKGRDFRLLIPEEKVTLLKRLLHDFPLNRGGFLSEFERDKLKRAIKLYSTSQAGAAPHP
jgi:hypothetical protein